MAVLHAFAIDDITLSLAELGRRTGIAKGTLHRVVSDMTGVRLLERTSGGYRLGSRVFELGMRASVERSLLEVAIPFMEDLYVRTLETVHLGVLDQSEVMYLSKIGGHRQARSPSRVGGRMPLHCTAIGKVLLANADVRLQEQLLAMPLARLTSRTIATPRRLRAQLNRVAVEGVAYEFEESATGIVCVAAAVRDADDQTVAAISVTGTSQRFRPESTAASVRAAADGMGVTLTRRQRLLADRRML